MKFRFACTAFAAAAVLLNPHALNAVSAQPALVDCEVGDAARDLDGIEAALLDRINLFRGGQGLIQLERSPVLERAARWKVVNLAAGGPRQLTAGDHDDPGRPWDQRFLDCGYPVTASFGENLGLTNGTIDDLFAGWLQSPSHLANLQDPEWRYTGLARAEVDGFTFWTNTFGSEP